MSLLSEELIKLTENEVKYHSLNGTSILNFPLHVPVSISIEVFLNDLFSKYLQLLNDQRELLKSEYCFSEDELNHICPNVKYVSTKIINALGNYKNGKIKSAYNNIKDAVEKGQMQKIELKEDDCKTFYRMRSGLGHAEEKEFYHVPFDKLYLTDSYRFSMSGFPCLYMGYTEEVCKKEIRADGSVIQMELKNNNRPPLKLVDLTWFEASYTERDSFLISFPIIAACYIVPNYCKSLKKECEEIKPKFKEQYVIPQLVSAFIRENMDDVNGIRYYTTRNENLEPQKTDDMNIALFANYERVKTKNRLYDENITSNRFTFTNPHDVKI